SDHHRAVYRAVWRHDAATHGAPAEIDRGGFSRKSTRGLGRAARFGESLMFAIIGIVVVFGCVVAGYLMEHGNLKVLIQPAELVIIGGAAVGTVLIANPLHIIKKIAGGIGGVFGGSKFGKKTYVDTLKMMYDLLNKARKDGLMALEADVEDPSKSPIFSKNTAFVKNHHVCDFVCDSMRMAITGVEAF